jgi:hypothetical protein
MRPHPYLPAVFTNPTFFRLSVDAGNEKSIILIVTEGKTNRKEPTMTNYTDKAMFTAIVNADASALAAIFGEGNVTEVVDKAARKLVSLNKRAATPRKVDDSKRLANLAAFNDTMAAYIDANKCVTVADIRANVAEDMTASKVAAILKVAVAEGLIERHEVKQADGYTVKCGTYYTVNGYEFERKAA